MAAFNPNVPEVDPTRVPEYLQESRAISPYDIRGLANKGKAETLSSIAKVLPEAVDAAYKVNEHMEENDKNALVDKGNDAFISALGTLRNKTDDNVNADGTPQGGTQAADKGMSLLTKPEETDTKSLPPEVQAGLSKADTISAALAAGKISPTAYLANRDAIAKELRARYPGMRKVIDEQMGHTANELVHSMITDLNARGAQANKIEDEIRADFRSIRGDPRAPGLQQWWEEHKGEPGALNKIRTQLNDFNYSKWETETLKQRVEQVASSKTLDKQQIEPYITHVAEGMQYQTVSGGISGPAAPSVEDIYKHAQDHLAGTDSWGDEQWGHADQTMTLTRQQAYARFVHDMSARNGSDPNAPSMADRYGREGLKTLFDQSWSTFDAMHEAIHSKNFALSATNALALKAAHEDFTKAMFTDKDVKEYSMTTEFIKQNFTPEVANKYFTDHLLPTNDKISNAIDHAIKLQRAKLIAGPQANRGIQPSFDSGLQVLKSKLQSQGNPAEAYVAYLDTLKIATDPTMKDPKIIGNIADAAFGNANASFLADKNFQRDYTDSKGITHPGKIAVYQSFGNPVFVKKVLGLNDPTKTQNMKNWFEGSFAKEIVPGELKELGKFSNVPGVKLTYNTDTNQLAVVGGPKASDYGFGLQGPGDYVRAMNVSIRNLNMALRTLGSVEKATGGDTEAFLATVLVQQGVDPTKIEGFHKALLKTIVSSRRGMSEEEQQGIVGRAVGDERPSPPGQNLGTILGIDYGPETRTRK